MKNTFRLQSGLDFLAITLSVLCAVHCLFLPLAVILSPTLLPFLSENELTHKILLLAIVPTSLVALTMGCKKHKRYTVYLYGGLGLFFLAAWEAGAAASSNVKKTAVKATSGARRVD